MTQVQDAQQATNLAQQGNGETPDANGETQQQTAQPKPMPEADQRHQSMVAKAKARLEKGSETNPHLKHQHREQERQQTGQEAVADTVTGESQATEPASSTTGESGAISTSGDQDNQNRTDAVDSSTSSDTQQASQEKAESQKEEQITLDQAKQAMKRSQWGDEQINALPEDEIIKAGSKLVKREAEREKNYQEKQQIKNTLSELGLNAETPEALKESLSQILGQQQIEPAQPSGEQQQQQQQATTETQSGESEQQQKGGIKDAVHRQINEAMQQLSEDELMSDSADSLKKAMTGALDQVIDHYEGRFSQTANPADASQNGSNEIEQIRQQYETLAMDQRMLASGLDSEYDQLKDPETRGKVRDQAKHLVDSDKDGALYYDGSGNPQWHKALRHAAYLQIGASNQDQSAPQQYKADMLNRQRAVSAGQPSPDREAGGPHKDTSNMSKMERMTMMAKARQEGRSEQDIQKLRQQLYGRTG